jgi:hypothetical protein
MLHKIIIVFFNFNIYFIIYIIITTSISTFLKQLIISQSKKPSDAFVNYILGEMRTGRKTKTLVNVFREYTKIALKSLISDDKQKGKVYSLKRIS